MIDRPGGGDERPATTFIHRLRRAALLPRLGPGLITGAADDDPSGIATYSQAGAQFGVNMLWTMLFLYPLMSTMQMISARIGRVTGHGLAANMRRIFPPWAVTGLVALLFIANTINIGADLAAMGAAADLVLGWGRHLFTPLFAVISLSLQTCDPLSPLCPLSEVADLGALLPMSVSSSPCRSIGARSPCGR